MEDRRYYQHLHLTHTNTSNKRGKEADMSLSLPGQTQGKNAHTVTETNYTNVEGNRKVAQKTQQRTALDRGQGKNPEA